jgi:TolB-like protein
MAVLLILAAIALSAWRLLGRPQDTSVIHSIAVLPLKSFSNDPAQSYFAYGMTDELTTALAQIHTLRVVSHTSVLRYENTTRALPDIARDLRVDAVVEGTVQRSGDHLLLTVQLIKGSTDRHIWAGTYDRDLRDVLAIQNEVATAIAHAIQVQLTPQEQVRLRNSGPINPKALDAYLTGRHYLRTSIDHELRIGLESRSQAEFRQAVAV